MTSENTSQEAAPTSANSSGLDAQTTTPSVETSAPSSTPVESAQDKTSTTPGAVVAPPVVTPAYQPNFKFKAFDKEYEVDELYRGLMKDPETEDKIKKLHSKAYAMEVMKEKLEGTRKDHETFKTTIQPKLQSFEYFNNLVANKDWDTFFKKLGVPDEEMYAFVEKKLALAQASPDQKAEYMRQQQMREQHYAREQQFNELQNVYQQQAVQTRTIQLDMLMNRPDVAKYATSWDEKMGTVGAFRQLVIDEASAAFYQTQRDLTPEEAINAVIQKFGKVVVSQNPTMPSMSQQQPQAMTPPPVIPVISGKGTSPVKKVPKSLDDLKKLADEMAT